MIILLCHYKGVRASTLYIVYPVVLSAHFDNRGNKLFNDLTLVRDSTRNASTSYNVSSRSVVCKQITLSLRVGVAS